MSLLTKDIYFNRGKSSDRFNRFINIIPAISAFNVFLAKKCFLLFSITPNAH